jgi:hypothetical protein
VDVIGREISSPNPKEMSNNSKLAYVEPGDFPNLVPPRRIQEPVQRAQKSA